MHDALEIFKTTLSCKHHKYMSMRDPKIDVDVDDVFMGFRLLGKRKLKLSSFASNFA